MSWAEPGPWEVRVGESLSLEELVARASPLVASLGRGFSLPRVARELGVSSDEVRELVADRTELLLEIADAAIASAPPLEPGAGPWDYRLFELVWRVGRELAALPEAWSAAVLAGAATGPGMIRFLDDVMGLLLEAGLDRTEADEACQHIVVFLAGWRQELAAVEARVEHAVVRRRRDRLRGMLSTYPGLSSLAPYYLDVPLDEAIPRSLRLLVDGIAAGAARAPSGVSQRRAGRPGWG
ncbi:MAG: TetR/AcrR family transcriptional regulator C-terminal domain-containing protein [Acidimicrobiales bacterium]